MIRYIPESKVGLSADESIASDIIPLIEREAKLYAHLLKIKWSNKGIQVIPTDDFELQIAKSIPSRYKACKNEKGEYFLPLIKDLKNRGIPEGPIITFRNKPIAFEVINDFKEVDKKFPHPAITSKICKKFSRILTGFAANTNYVTNNLSDEKSEDDKRIGERSERVS
jgi:hypothetical protein